MEKTAIEYAIQEIEKLAGIKISRDENCIKKANEMFEQQIIKSHTNGWNNGIKNEFISSQQYYNETFKK